MSNCQLHQIPSLISENCMLNMLKSHIKKQNETPSSITSNLCHLNTLLRTKNQKITRRLKHSNAQNNALVYEESRKRLCFDEIRLKVIEQMERTKQNLLKAAARRKINDKRKKIHDQNEIKNILQKSHVQNAMMNANDHFESIGWLEGARLAAKLGMKGENKQEISSLISCFQHILNDEQPILLINRNSILNKKLQLNLSQYSAFFTQIIKLNREENTSENNLMNKFEQVLPKIPNEAKNNKYFQIMFMHLSLFLKNQKNSGVFTKNRQRNNLFDCLQLEESKNEKYDGDLKEQMLWQKLFYLFKKKQKYHSLIIIHLQQFNYHELSTYFKNVINGKNSQYIKDLRLYNSNMDYKKFVWMLQRKYLDQCLNQGQEIEQSEILAILIKQIYLKELFHENCEAELTFLKKYTSQLSKKFRFQINAKTKFQQVQLIMIRLLYLCQFQAVLEILLDYQRINEVHALLILSIVQKIEPHHSYLFLYDKAGTSLFAQNIFKKIAKGLHKFYQFSQFSRLLIAFCPLLNGSGNSSSLCIDILSEKKQLFQFLVQNQVFTDFSGQLNLSFSHLSAIFDSLIQKHSCYAYCIQLGLSVCISLENFNNNSKKSHEIDPFSNKITYRQSDKLKEQSSYWINGFDQKKQNYFESVKKDQKMFFLLEVIERLSRINIDLSTNFQKRQIYYEELCFCNELLLRLKNKELVQLLSQNLQLKQSQFTAFIQKLQIQLKCLLFTFNVFKLRICIVNGQFQFIINLFNNFIEEIAPSNELIIQSLDKNVENKFGKKLYLTYLGQLVQSTILLNRQKRKVVIRNRYLFKVMCKIISDQLKHLREVDKDEVQLIERFLQRTSNDIINL